jgi:hypothetical protein
MKSMYALGNELIGIRPAPAVKRILARPGWLPRFLIGALFRAWVLATTLFDGDRKAKPKPRVPSRQRAMERPGLSMKKTASILALIFILGMIPTQSRAEETDQAKDAAVKQTEAATEEAEEKNAEKTEDAKDDAPPPFTLITEEDDSPELARLKAALRLWKHAQVTTKALQTCPDTPGAGKTLKEFQNRNGNTLPILLNIIKTSGGLTPEIRALIEKEVNEDTAVLLEETGCEALTAQVAKNARDIYKAPDLAEDYRLVRTRPAKK